ncbi:hypothetical protein ZWY2020_014919 [Hordeum vulgare]|nr:hypothetical protein ZWY2020_014919 [Hordeum vulgare]
MEAEVPGGQQYGSMLGRSEQAMPGWVNSCIGLVSQMREQEGGLGQEDLDRYTNQHCQSAVDLANYHKDRHERCQEKLDEIYEELEEANAEIKRLKRMNKAVQTALAAIAPVAAIIAVTSAWVAKSQAKVQELEEDLEQSLQKVMSSDSSGSMYHESDEEDMDDFDAYPTTTVCQEEGESDSDGCGKGNRKGGCCPINSRGSVKRYVREEVLVSAGRVKSELLGGKVKSNISGCSFFIQVFYLDNLDLEDDNLPHDVFPRCKFILPVKFNFTWSTYIWDFPKKRIIVLDPTINNGDESDKVIQDRHRKVADNLHVALQTCIQEFFQGWAPDMARWNLISKGLNVGLCTGADNGVYALHYGRNWMGSKFKRVLNPQNDGVINSRMNILIDVLGLEGNIGHMPERYRKFLVRKKE